jgi:NDP-sugar pyrophosphorylase family protein
LITSNEEMRKSFPIYSYLLPESANWRDAGTATELLQANMDVLHGLLETGLSKGGFFMEHPNKVFISPSAKVDPTAKLENVIVEDGAVIGAHSDLKDCVVGRGVRVGKHVIAKETVFMQKHRDNVNEVVSVGNNLILDRSMVLGCDVEASQTNRFDSMKIFENNNGEQETEGIQVEKYPEPPKA